MTIYRTHQSPYFSNITPTIRYPHQTIAPQFSTNENYGPNFLTNPPYFPLASHYNALNNIYNFTPFYGGFQFGYIPDFDWAIW